MVINPFSFISPLWFQSGQDFKGAIDQCTKEFDMDMDVVISLKYGDFSERDPLIEVCVCVR